MWSGGPGYKLKFGKISALGCGCNCVNNFHLSNGCVVWVCTKGKRYSESGVELWVMPIKLFLFLLKKFFFIWTIFKVLIELVTMLFLRYVWLLGHEACGILAHRPGIEPAPSALEGRVLPTGPPGRSSSHSSLKLLPGAQCVGDDPNLHRKTGSTAAGAISVWQCYSEPMVKLEYRVKGPWLQGRVQKLPAQPRNSCHRVQEFGNLHKM